MIPYNYQECHEASFLDLSEVVTSTQFFPHLLWIWTINILLIVICHHFPPYCHSRAHIIYRSTLILESFFLQDILFIWFSYSQMTRQCDQWSICKTPNSLFHGICFSCWKSATWQGHMQVSKPLIVYCEVWSLASQETSGSTLVGNLN